MLLHRVRGLWIFYHVILAFVLTIVFWTYIVVLEVGFQVMSEGYRPFPLYNLAAVVGLAIAAVRGRSTAATFLAGGFVDSCALAFKQVVLIGVAILVVMVAAVDPPGPPLRKLALIVGFLVSIYVVFLLCHLVVPKRLAHYLFSSKEYEQRTLLIGPIDKARNIAKWIEETGASGFGVKGTVRADDDEEESRILHLSRVADVSRLEQIIRNQRIKQIFLLAFPLDREALGLVINTANKAAVRLLVLNNLPEIFNHDITLFKLHDQEFIGLRDEPLEDPVSRTLKRAMDLAFSIPVVLLVLPPLCLAVKIFQAIQSPGPLFYRQTRARANRKSFRIYKFRTMRIDQGDTSSKQATVGDPRIYRMGRILRKTSLDEIPQFLNVFFGHMSVVGPRPHMIIHNRRFSDIMDMYHVRTFAKPGITGLAQVSGFRGEAKNNEEIIERAKLDIKYIEEWSLAGDFEIIFKTMVQVVKPPPTAY